MKFSTQPSSKKVNMTRRASMLFNATKLKHICKALSAQCLFNMLVSGIHALKIFVCHQKCEGEIKLRNCIAAFLHRNAFVHLLCTVDCKMSATVMQKCIYLYSGEIQSCIFFIYFS